MPGAMHRMGVYLGLVKRTRSTRRRRQRTATVRATGAARREDYAEPRYAREHGHGRERPRETGTRDRHRDHGDASLRTATSTTIRAVRRGVPPTYQITSLHPRTYNEARTIGEHFRKSTPVIMNLSEMDDADAKRLVDFAAGLTFGLHGRIERVTAKVFLLSPHNVTVTAQDKAKIESGFFNQS